MAEAEIWNSNILRNLRLVAEARGLKFYIHPPREIVPAFLGDFRPDAIAVAPDGGIVIKLIRREGQQAEPQLSAIANTVSNQKGWEFRAVYVNPVPNDPPDIALPTRNQLHAAIEEIKSLINGGHRAAALVAAWAALESLARLSTAYSGTERNRSLSPIQAVQRLAEQGYLENEAAERLLGMLKLRNAVVHGDLSVMVPHDQIEDMLELLRSVAQDVLSVMASTGA